MFEEDQSGDLLLEPTLRSEEAQFDLDAAQGKPVIVVGSAAAQLIAEPTPEPAPGINAVKTLREMLYASEPWSKLPPGVDSPPGMPQLLEKRINRVLGVVADWMLATVEESLGDDETLVVLLELAEKVRQQIEWPERDAQAAGWHERNAPRLAADALARETQELMEQAR